MRVIFSAVAFVISISSAFAVPAQAAELLPYKAHYDVLRGSSNYGEALRELEQEADSNKYKLYTETEISLLFLSDRRRFWTEFNFVDGQVKSEKFDYKRSGTGSNKSFASRFDYAAKQIINTKNGAIVEVEWQEQRIDEASHLEQLRFDLQTQSNELLEYVVLDEKGRSDDMRYRIIGEEQLQLPYGAVTAIKVERVREHSSRETSYWFAPELDYVLVQMTQRDDGEEVATLQLRRLQN